MSEKTTEPVSDEYFEVISLLGRAHAILGSWYSNSRITAISRSRIEEAMLWLEHGKRKGEYSVYVKLDD